MLNKIVRFIFFGNYFVGILAVALTIEATYQLRLPFNSLNYYLLLFLAPTIYYTYAYNKVSNQPSATNPRTQWYFEHKKIIGWSQILLFVCCIFLSLNLLYQNYLHILNLPVIYWLAIIVIVIAGALYYGLLPRSFLKFNLRNTGWLKAFVIGFVWACCANVLPLIMLKIETGIGYHDSVLWAWLFIKNWMFCTVNAIMFDMKDYEDDANIELKTFAVRMGLKNTVFYVLVPLLLIGLFSFLTFSVYRHFSLLTILLNLVPFVCLLIVAFSLQRPRKILYYLIVIDGLLLVKAICGIAGTFFSGNYVYHG